MEHPWDRQPGEPSRWFDRFTAYCLMGSGRSILGTYTTERRKAGKSPAKQTPGAWSDASFKWNWPARAEAWDAHQRELDLLKMRQLQDERIKKIMADRWELREAFLEKTRTMLSWPVFERQITDNDQTIIFNPVKWTAADVVKFAQAAEQFSELSVPSQTTELEAMQVMVKAGLVAPEALTELQAKLQAVEDCMRKWVGGKSQEPTQSRTVEAVEVGNSTGDGCL